MKSYTGKTAIVTGASSGIGLAFAHELAARRMNLLLVARSQATLDALAADLHNEHGIRADVIVADLSEQEAPYALRDEIQLRGMPVHMVVNNAGLGSYGLFRETNPSVDSRQVAADVFAVTNMAHAFLPILSSHEEAAMINVSSTAAFQPVPYMAVYAASKSFVLNFSAALSEEYRRSGVRILGLAPGATDTRFFALADAKEASLGRRRSPEQVVATALRALERNQGVVVDGWLNNLIAQGPRLLPRTVAAKIAGWIIRPRRATSIHRDEPSIEKGD